MRATGGSALVPPMTQALPNTSKVKPSEPPVLAATVAGDEPLDARSAGTYESSVALDGVLLAPIQSAPLLAMRAVDDVDDRGLAGAHARRRDVDHR